MDALKKPQASAFTMRQLSTLLLVFIILTTTSASLFAQQFLGLDTRPQSHIQQMAYNPAWVTGAETGTEVMVFSFNVLAGTNAYSFDRDFIIGGFNTEEYEGEFIQADYQPYQKHMWANVEINGPAFSMQYKDKHFIGLYTRGRQIYRAGNLRSTELRLLGTDTLPDLFYGPDIHFEKAGFTTHTFTEIGVTYGRVLQNDYYNIIRGGVSLKYMMGFVAGTIYTKNLDLVIDSLGIPSLQGDLTMLYTHNISSFIDENAQNDLTSWFKRAGRAGLGLDIGAQYEYHPDGNPNRATPYVFSIAASLTDIGGIGYIADTGSAHYDINVKNLDTADYLRRQYEPLTDYLLSLDVDSILGNNEKREKFRMGLPTALRVNADYNVSEKFNFAMNILLNLRGNGGSRYRPAYVSYVNFTPTYRGKIFSAGLPVTVMGYQTLAAGLFFRVGPFYLGSSSALSSIMASRLKNIDVYTGLSLKFRKKKGQRAQLQH